jgi:hypothetical protein
MGILSVFPLLLIPAVLYWLFAATQGGANVNAWLAEPAFSIGMSGGGQWVLTHGHLFTLLSIFCLFFEIIKSVRPTTAGMIDNSLSVLVFIVCLVLFLLVPGFGTSEFFIILLMSILDFMAGAVVMVTSARRSVEIDRGH